MPVRIKKKKERRKKKKTGEAGSVPHTCDPSTGGKRQMAFFWVTSRLAWSTKLVQNSQLYTEKPCQEKQMQENHT